MLRRLLTPRRILVHAGVALLVVIMVNLGMWQMRRLEEKKSFNSAVAARTSEPVGRADLVLAEGTDPSSVDWRRVAITGTYDAAEAVIVVNRSQDGAAGVDSLVPLRTTDGTVWLVNRGFVPLSMAVPAPQSGQVTVVGYLRRTQTRGALGAIDSSDTDTKEFQRFDVERIAEQVDGDVAPMWVQRIEEVPSPDADWPAVVKLPALDEGPHLSYAAQWFFFSLVAVVGWFVAMRRSLRADDDPTTA